MYNLDRFINEQAYDYANALKEVKQGYKSSHWIWYIFPQLKSLGRSGTAKYFGIENIEEAKEYYANEILHDHLIEITQALLDLHRHDPEHIFGFPDTLKVRSCMTLFYAATNDPIFKQVIDQYYHGEFDTLTLRELQ